MLIIWTTLPHPSQLQPWRHQWMTILENKTAEVQRLTLLFLIPGLHRCHVHFVSKRQNHSRHLRSGHLRSRTEQTRGNTGCPGRIDSIIEVNFINILRAAFLMISFYQKNYKHKLQVQKCWVKHFWVTKLYVSSLSWPSWSSLLVSSFRERMRSVTREFFEWVLHCVERLWLWVVKFVLSNKSFFISIKNWPRTFILP